MLDTHQQIKTLIDNSKNILICFRKNWTIDAVASALALALWLEKQNKHVAVAADNFEATEQVGFLPVDKIKREVINLRKFVISLNLEKTGVEEFSYDVDDKNLKIFITPKEGFFEERDVAVGATEFSYDLILVVDTPDLESLGFLFEKNRDFFYQTPIVNFDHTPHNEHHGQVNLIDLKAVSVSEVIYIFLKEYFFEMIDSQIATCLLTGMFDKTNSFKTANLTPRTLENVSNLIQLGADRETVVKNLYQSKTLSTLKLWGRILARLNQDKTIKLVWSLLTHEDFVKSGADETDIKGVVNELVKSIPGAEIVLVLYEKTTTLQSGQDLVVCGQLFTSQNYNSIELARVFRPEGSHELVKFCLPAMKLLTAEKTVIDEIRRKVEVG